ncbi:MAG: polyprenyl synthetase family protein [Candidatus Cryptobacteroides sp.]|nr:polyprenyl synthetase family protein [Rikenellaceae bacterium]MDY5746277.1 polyprenyl synthetase family protein [Candidatus Cryptobacteroides sp.]
MINENRISEQVKLMFRDIEFTREPKGLYDPLRYMIEIGGKRVRPSLCLTTYSFFRDEFDEGILSPATALEVFHSFTLMHDDIMDHSPLRRGMPTVWKKWNEDTAILSGDVMLIDAYRRISKAPHEVLGRVMSLFSTTAAQVCDGQQYDMDFESESEVPMEEYRKMIGLKTAVLLACSAEMGAIIGGASEEVCKAIYNYGYELGMAFQVADDYLDAFGDEKVFGKPIGGDIVNGKKSWLTVRTLEKTDDKEGFLKAFGEIANDQESRDAKIEKVKKYYTDCAVDSDAKIEIAGFTWKALEAVSDIGLMPENIEMLRNFAEKLVGRAK